VKGFIEVVVLAVWLVDDKNPNQPFILAALDYLADAQGLRLAFGLPCLVGFCLVGFVGHCSLPGLLRAAFSSSYRSMISASTSTIAASIASIRVKVRQLPTR
jgi:hypothetical protein